MSKDLTKNSKNFFNRNLLKTFFNEKMCLFIFQNFVPDGITILPMLRLTYTPKDNVYISLKWIVFEIGCCVYLGNICIVNKK